MAKRDPCKHNVLHANKIKCATGYEKLTFQIDDLVVVGLRLFMGMMLSRFKAIIRQRSQSLRTTCVSRRNMRVWGPL